MKKQLLYFSLFLLIVSCYQKESRDSSKNIIKKEIETVAVQEQEQYIENETILTKMESDLFELTKNPKFTMEKELVNNIDM